jgi:hypothetical protein
MDDLIAFLNARLDEDEEKAKRVEPNQAPVQLRAMVTRGGSQPFLVIPVRLHDRDDWESAVLPGGQPARTRRLLRTCRRETVPLRGEAVGSGP